MKITFTNGRFIEYRKSDLFEHFGGLCGLRETIFSHPFGVGHKAIFLGRSPGHKYQLVEVDGSWRFIALRGSGLNLEIIFRSDPLTESEAESVANQHNASILIKVP